jgi:predicted PurR-regulated permease PerM
VGGAVANWSLIGITTFLMVLERREIGKFILDAAPKHLETYIKNHYTIIQHVCTSWIKATLILSGSIFTLTFVGLSLLEWIFGFTTGKIFTLALIGGIMEFIPYV